MTAAAPRAARSARAAAPRPGARVAVLLALLLAAGPAAAQLPGVTVTVQNMCSL
jgi:hypothetical protein